MPPARASNRFARTGRFESRDGILEAPRGFVETLLGDGFDWDELTRDLGKRFQLVDPGYNIKRFRLRSSCSGRSKPLLPYGRNTSFVRRTSPSWNWKSRESHERSGHAGPQAAVSMASSISPIAARWRLPTGESTSTPSATPGVLAESGIVLGKVRIKRNPDIPRIRLITGLWPALDCRMDACSARHPSLQGLDCQSDESRRASRQARRLREADSRPRRHRARHRHGRAGWSPCPTCDS